MVVGGNSPHGENHLAEGGAAAQELQGDLRVGKFAQGLQQVRGFVDSLLRVRVAELWGSNGGTKELEVAVPNDFEIRREGAHVDRGGSSSGKDKLAFVLEVGRARAELQADFRASKSKVINGGTDGSSFASQAQVVEV